MPLSWIITTSLSAFSALLFALRVRGHGNLVPPPDAQNFVCFGVYQVLELRPAVKLFNDDIKNLTEDVYNSVVNLIHPPLILGIQGGEILDMNVTVAPVLVSSTHASTRELSGSDLDVTVLMAHYTVISTEGGQSFQSLSSLLMSSNSSGSSPLGSQLTRAIKAHKYGHLCCDRTVKINSTTFSRYSSGFLSSTSPTSSYETSPAQKFALALCFMFIAFVVAVQYYILLGETQSRDFVGRWKVSPASRSESEKSSEKPAHRQGSEAESPQPRANGSKKINVNDSLGSNGNGPVGRSSGTVIDGVGEAIKIEENPLHSSLGRRPVSLNLSPRAPENIDGVARISILAASMGQPSQGLGLGSPLGPSPTRKSANDTSSKRGSDRLLLPVLPPLPPIPPSRSPSLASGDGRPGNGAGRPMKEWHLNT